MNNFDLCRKNLLDRLNISELKRRNADDMSVEIRRMTTALHTTLSLAEPRLIMGGLRHGSDWEHEPLMEYMQKKFNTYRKTGNFEMLVDLFNFCGAVEPVLKTHPKFHFDAKDR